MKKIGLISIFLILLGILLGFGVIGLKTAISKAERVECEKWISDSEKYVLFFWADWQVEQCKAHGYTVDK